MKLDTGAIGHVNVERPYWTKALGSHMSVRPVNIHPGETEADALAFAAAIRESYAAHVAYEAALPDPAHIAVESRAASDVTRYRSVCNHAEPCRDIEPRTRLALPAATLATVKADHRPKRRTIASVKAAVTDALRQLGDTGQDIGGFADGLRMALLIMED